ncbi:MAG: [NiFe]-hydrogenase assembly chaperone HybE [Anaeromyxobacter sp.]
MTADALARARDVELAFELAAPSMAGVPVCNRTLSIEVVGMRPHAGGYAGVLVTPWTVSLVLVGAHGAPLARLAPGEAEVVEFPAGPFALAAAEGPELGPYRTLSLLSPPEGLVGQDDARAAARAALSAIFDPPAPPAEEPAPPPEADLPRGTLSSRRAFLRGGA